MGSSGRITNVCCTGVHNTFYWGLQTWLVLEHWAMCY
jgi:hypothetical protein